MKILLAVDGSPYTQKMLDFLTQHRDWLVASNDITVIHVTEPLPHRSAAGQTAEKVREMYLEDSALVLNPIRTFLSEHGVAAKFVSEVGLAGNHIAQAAQQGGFDLIVMGSHGHGAMANMVMGSVASKVLSYCKTPVLLIR